MRVVALSDRREVAATQGTHVTLNSGADPVCEQEPGWHRSAGRRAGCADPSAAQKKIIDDLECEASLRALASGVTHVGQLIFVRAAARWVR